MNANSAVCAWVDQLVLEQGRYAPVELLLRRGDLDYGDYERWRSGLGGVLESHLQAARIDIRETLQQAGRYAHSLGLSPRSASYPATGGEHPGQPLRFSTDPQHDVLYHTLYERGPSSPQLDLFLDSHDTVHEHALLDALASGQDADTLAACLGHWAQALPDSARLAEYRQLLALARRAQAQAARPAAVLDMLQHRLVPLAERLLGRYARDFLTPHWRALSRHLAGQAFDPRLPLLHASHSCAQALDWAGARDAIEREPAWQDEPVLLARHAAACERLRDRGAMFASWCRLCWDHPHAAVRLISGAATPTLAPYWQAFQDLEPQLPVADFPAYLVLSHADFAPYAPSARKPAPSTAETAFGHALALALARNEPIGREVLRHRRALQDLRPALFDYALRVTAP